MQCLTDILLLRDLSMKYLCVALAFATVGLAAERPKTADCFKVNWLLRADEEHYWANWTNKCSYTIDSVYVMVRFADGNQSVGNGVWGLHFVTPGESRVTRFSTPGRVPDFRTVHIRKITTDMEEALRPSGESERLASKPDRPTGDPGPKVPESRPSGTLVAEQTAGQ
jgi:hypothetical protein